MKTLNIKLEVENRIEAHRLINKLSKQYDVKEARFSTSKVVLFDKEEKIKKFLK